MSKHIEKLVILLMLSMPVQANDVLDTCIDKLHLLIRDKTNTFLMVRDTMYDMHDFWDRHKYPREVFERNIQQAQTEESIRKAARRIYVSYLYFNNPADVMERTKRKNFDEGFMLLRAAIREDWR